LLRELSRQVNAEIRAARELVEANRGKLEKDAR
jgi:hypothetical protein